MLKQHLVALSMAVALATPSAFAFSPIYSVDIDSMPLGVVNSQGVSTFTSSGGNQAVVVADPTGAGRGQVIQLSNPAPTGNERRVSAVLFTWDVQNGPKDLVNPLYLKVKIMFDVYVEPNAFQNLYFTNSDRDTNFTQTINDGKWFQFGDTKTPGGTIVGGKWWTVTLDWDMVAAKRAGNITDGTNSYDVTANGLGLHQDPSGGSVQFYRFNIRTITDFRPSQLPGTWYVDNFKVQAEAVPEPATLAVLGLGALALVRRRRNR